MSTNESFSPTVPRPDSPEFQSMNSKEKKSAKLQHFSYYIDRLAEMVEDLIYYYEFCNDDKAKTIYANKPGPSDFRKLHKHLVSMIKKVTVMTKDLNKGVRTTDFTGINAPVLFNNEVLAFVNKAKFGPQVAGTVVKSKNEKGETISTVEGLRVIPNSLLQSSLIGVTGVQVNGQRYFLSQVTTVSRLLMLNIYHSAANINSVDSGALRITQDMVTYLPNTLALAETKSLQNKDLRARERSLKGLAQPKRDVPPFTRNGTFTYPAVNNISRGGIVLGSDGKPMKTDTLMSLVSPLIQQNQVAISSEIQNSETGSPTGQNPINMYVLHDNNKTKKAYALIQDSRPNNKSKSRGAKSAAALGTGAINLQ